MEDEDVEEDDEEVGGCLTRTRIGDDLYPFFNRYTLYNSRTVKPVVGGGAL